MSLNRNLQSYLSDYSEIVEGVHFESIFELAPASDTDDNEALLKTVADYDAFERQAWQKLEIKEFFSTSIFDNPHDFALLNLVAERTGEAGFAFAQMKELYLELLNKKLLEDGNKYPIKYLSKEKSRLVGKQITIKCDGYPDIRQTMDNHCKIEPDLVAFMGKGYVYHLTNCQFVENVDFALAPCYCLKGIVSEQDKADVGLFHFYQLLKISYLIGIAQKSFDLIKEYILVREQFRKKIAQFQAIQHHMSNSFLLLKGNRSLRDVILCNKFKKLDFANNCNSLALLAKDELIRVIEITMQISGGIGFTWHHPLNLLIKRALRTAEDI